jgi:predicted DNA-binding transcriptional regulator YafY
MAHEYERLLQCFELLSRIDDNALLSCVQAEHRLPPIGDLFYEILCAIRNRCIIEITYEHYRNVNKLGVHILSPRLLKESQHRWYVIGYNDADELRVYALERIKNVSILKYRKFRPKPIEEIKRLFAESYGIWVDNKQEVEDIVIKYDKLDGSFVKSLPLHHTQRVLEEDENSVTIGLQLRITNDFVMALLARSRSIEIIKPISLRQRVYNTLCDAVERNRV